MLSWVLCVALTECHTGKFIKKAAHFSLSKGLESPVCLTEAMSGEGASCYVFPGRCQSTGGSITCRTGIEESEKLPAF